MLQIFLFFAFCMRGVLLHFLLLQLSAQNEGQGQFSAPPSLCPALASAQVSPPCWGRGIGGKLRNGNRGFFLESQTMEKAEYDATIFFAVAAVAAAAVLLLQ